MLLGWATILFWLLLDWTRVLSITYEASAAPDAGIGDMATIHPLQVKQWTADG